MDVFLLTPYSRVKEILQSSSSSILQNYSQKEKKKCLPPRTLTLSPPHTYALICWLATVLSPPTRQDQTRIVIVIVIAVCLAPRPCVVDHHVQSTPQIGAAGINSSS